MITKTKNMITRKSKIGRLPFILREELNQKLMDNVPTKDILNWLNTDSAVRQCMERLFENRQITEQNLSEWRQGGYQEWLDYNSCVEDVRDLSEQAARAALTDISGEHLLLALTAMLACMVKNIDKTLEPSSARRQYVVESLIKTALSLRRSEQRDEALRLKREQLEILREKSSHKSPSTRHAGASAEAASCPPSSNETRASSSSNNLRSNPAHPVPRPQTPSDPTIDPSHPDWAAKYDGSPNKPADPTELPNPMPAEPFRSEGVGRGALRQAQGLGGAGPVAP